MKGLINHTILKGVKRGKNLHIIRRHLSIYYNIKIGYKAFLLRYGNIKRRYSN